MVDTRPWVWLTLLFCLAAAGLRAAEPVTIQSRSGQFYVAGIPVGKTSKKTGAKAAEDNVYLDPALLAVSCEKIKRALLNILKVRDQWESVVHVGIESGASPEDLLEVQSIRFLDRWQYRLFIPEEVPRKRLLKTIVEVLLLEIVQRRSSQPVELPPWLGEGLTAMMRTGSQSTLALDPNTFIAQDQRVPDSLYLVRQRLQVQAPLTLDEITWPSNEQREGKAGELYENCAHLFVHGLLGLRDGRACLQNMLRILPEHLNWQTAFLLAFKEHFPRMIDLDKWWSLTAMQQAGRDLSYTWSLAESCQKLEGILSIPIEVRLESGDLPMTTQSSLQNLLQEWDSQRQEAVLTLKLNHLSALRLRVSRDLADLVGSYQEVLADFLEDLARLGPEKTQSSPPHPAYQSLVGQTVKRLDALDERRMALQRLIDLAAAKSGVTKSPSLPSPESPAP